MKTVSTITSLVAVIALAALPAAAASYGDATGDFTGGVAALDITSVDVNNDATMLSFTINLAGDPLGANWYDCYVGVSRNLYGGVGGNLNGTGGWGKDIQMSAGGMDFFLYGSGYWASGSLLTWDGSAWVTTGGSASGTTTAVTIPVSLAALGLTPGDSFTFDVWTSSSGNTVFDALSDTTSRTWNNVAFDTGANALSYTTVVPEPGVGALLGLGGLLVIRRLKGCRR